MTTTATLAQTRTAATAETTTAVPSLTQATTTSTGASSSNYGSIGNMRSLTLPRPTFPTLSYYAVRETFAILPESLPLAAASATSHGLSSQFGAARPTPLPPSPSFLPPVRFWQPAIVDNPMLLRMQQFALGSPSHLAAPLMAPLGAVLRYPPPMEQPWGVGGLHLAPMYPRLSQSQTSVQPSSEDVHHQPHHHQERQPRSTRTVFTTEQLARLEAEYEKQRYLTPSTRERLAQELGLTDCQVRTWFQNRRMKQNAAKYK